MDTYSGVMKSYLPYVDVEVADNTVAISKTFRLHTCWYEEVHFRKLLFTSSV